MKTAYLIQLSLFVSLMCIGQILFKKTAIQLSKSNEANKSYNSDILNSLLAVVQIPYFFFALIIYAIATFYWLYILQKIPLSLAYPFTALAMVIIPVASYFLFKESITIYYWFGALLIFLGIIVISIKGTG